MDEEVDNESFIEVESELNEDSYLFNGTTNLKSADLKDSQDINTDKHLEYDEYIVLECDISEDSIVIIPPYKDNNEYSFVFNWTNTEKFGSLCGEDIPVRQFDDDIYRPSNFTINYSYSIEDMKILYDDGLLYYNSKTGNWEEKDKLETVIELGLIMIMGVSLFIGSLVSYLTLGPTITAEHIFLSIMLGSVLTLLITYISDEVDGVRDPFYKIANFIS